MATNEQRREAAKRKLSAQQAHRTEQAAKRKRTTTIAAVSTVVVVAVAAIGVSLLAGAWNDGDDLAQGAAPAPAPGECAYPADGTPAKPVQPPGDGPAPTEGTVPVSMTTSAGPIDLTLDRAAAPCTVKSFESLVQQKYFDNTSCHRMTTTPGLRVLQCGDPTGQGTGGPGYTIPDEAPPTQTYERGQLAMAKTAAPDSGGSQFFMIYGEAQLPPEYTVFGTIGQEGLATLDKVAQGGESSGSGDGAPNIPVDIRTAVAG